ncbi:MAG: hypothetical protein HYR56_25980 [Acidobacteria bacterium]|nr:hypothetical protein [Acidobacteriota bacterium]MBI3427668.1 hypothetical protein [Acidobacteriota bacterium]
MSENDYKQLVERMLENDATSPMISSDTGVEAAQKAGQLAAQEEIEWAVAGGLAMHFYGSPRMTKDVDIIASNHLSLTPQHPLSFGGSSYSLQVGKYNVQVDWIVRNDGYRELYRKALKEAISLPNGLRVVTPEWLAILKFNAGRQKDLDDIVFLLKQEKLVDRPTVKQKVVETAGEWGWLTMLPGLRRLCDLADGNTKEPSKYYDQD